MKGLKFLLIILFVICSSFFLHSQGIDSWIKDPLCIDNKFEFSFGRNLPIDGMLSPNKNKIMHRNGEIYLLDAIVNEDSQTNFIYDEVGRVVTLINERGPDIRTGNYQYDEETGLLISLRFENSSTDSDIEAVSYTHLRAHETLR